MRKVKLLLLLICFGASIALHAGETGNLVGKVKNEKGEPLQGAFVLVYLDEDTMVGNTMTNEKGAYQIIGLMPGKYVVKINRMGFQKVVYQDVEIQLDVTKTLNVNLSVQTIKQKEIIIKDTKTEALDAKAGSSARVNDAKKLEDDNITSIDALLASAPGTVTVAGESHARGGRANETTIMIDGMQVSDPVDGGASLSVDMDAVHTTSQMFSFPAEYGNSQSSVMNIVTKSGTKDYEGSIKYATDHFLVDGYNYDKISFTLGGPVIPMAKFANKFTFFANAGLARSDGRDGEWRENNPYEDYTYNGVPLLKSGLYDFYNKPYEGRDNILGIDIDERNYNSYNYNAKFKYGFTPTQKVTLAFRGDYSKNLPYTHSMKYALDNYYETESSQMQIVGNYDYVSGTKILKLKGSYYKKNSKTYPRNMDKGDFWILDERLWDPESGNFGVYGVDTDADGVLDSYPIKGNQWAWNEIGEEDDKGVEGFNAPGSFVSSFTDNTTENIQFRTDLQYNPEDIGHQIKTGFELQRHFIQRDEISGLSSVDHGDVRTNLQQAFEALNLQQTGSVIIPGTGNDYKMKYYPENDICDSVLVIYDGPEADGKIESEIYYYKAEYYRYMTLRTAGLREGYKASPWQAAYYLQDQFTFEGMKVNAGLRFDWWYLNDSYEIQKVDGGFRTRDFEGDTSQLLISPRFGILYPISQRDNVSFLYNYQNQLPQMKHIFTTKDPEVDDVSFLNVGNPELEPQITVTYEVGYEHQFADDFSDYVIDIKAYYKNIYNYVSTRYDTLESDKDITYFQYVSQDYGSAKGLEVELTKGKGDSYYTLGLSYSLGWAKGNNDEAIPEVSRTSLREFRLPWDIRHSAKFRTNFIVERDDDFYIPVLDYAIPFGWKGRFNAGFNYSFSSGKPYTPVNEDDRALEKYSKEQDYVDEASMFFRKDFMLAEKQRLSVSFTINNLFDKKNVVAVYAKTGDPYDDGADLSSVNSNYVSPEREYVHHLSAANPSRYTDGRTFRLELSYNFN